MSINVLVIGDPHIKVNNVVETRTLVDSIVETIKERDIDHVVIAGDTLHKHNIIDVFASVEAHSMITRISELRPLVLLIGNHDLPSHTSYLVSHHNFNAYKMHPNVTVVDKCTPFTVKDIKFLALPYVPPGKFNDALSTYEEWRDVDVIFAHQEFIGCKMDRMYSKVGDVWDESLPLVISGHIHQYQRLGKNIVYVGTPRQSSFADTRDKALSLFTFSKGDTKILWEEERIPTRIPPKLEFTIAARDISTWAPPPDAVIKLTIVGTPSENSAALKHPDVKRWKREGIVINPKDTMPVFNASHTPTYKSTTAPSFLEIVRRKVEGDVTKMSLLREVTG